TLEEVMGELYEELAEQAINPSSMGVMTGFNGIDARLQGLRPGQMIVIGARPGVGKTSFALNLAINAAAQGASVAFFSLEMSKTEIAQRLLSAQARIPLSAIRGAHIQDNQWPALLEATNDLSRLDIMIDDTPGTTVTEVRAKARRMLRGKEKGVVILDYLQLVSPPSNQRRSDSRATEVSEMSRGIKIMAKDLGVPVISLSQLSRQVESRTGKRPQLSDLRESGSIEQDADIVILLDRSMTPEEAERQDRPDENVTDFIIAKNRSGPLDIVPLMFLPGSTKFVEVDTFHD
ncbi:MAG: DnaB-like helicase C-terminal domain-containing protein, partial [Atopobiaceae bacterium]|nr:DnaB-like helicase C-terminal domain-containing protein [Atopobiaceae bacterium]